MGRQPLSPAAAVTLAARLAHYAAQEDPPAAVANLVALVVASNGPFYPATVLWLIGRDGLPSFWTLAASPLFAAIPWLMRRSSLAGRAALPLLGAANTVWTEKLFGPEFGRRPVAAALPDPGGPHPSPSGTGTAAACAWARAGGLFHPGCLVRRPADRLHARRATASCRPQCRQHRHPHCLPRLADGRPAAAGRGSGASSDCRSGADRRW